MEVPCGRDEKGRNQEVIGSNRDCYARSLGKSAVKDFRDGAVVPFEWCFIRELTLVMSTGGFTILLPYTHVRKE
jgi:hypothetical protein